MTLILFHSILFCCPVAEMLLCYYNSLLGRSSSCCPSTRSFCWRLLTCTTCLLFISAAASTSSFFLPYRICRSPASLFSRTCTKRNSNEEILLLLKKQNKKFLFFFSYKNSNGVNLPAGWVVEWLPSFLPPRGALLCLFRQNIFFSYNIKKNRSICTRFLNSSDYTIKCKAVGWYRTSCPI